MQGLQTAAAALPESKLDCICCFDTSSLSLCLPGENTAGLYSNDVSIDVFLKVISYFSINCFHSRPLHQCLPIHVLSYLAFDKKVPLVFFFLFNEAVIALIPTSVLINGPHFIFLKCFTTS